jgi:peptide/nickel transport system ATP-binding protein
MTQVRRPPVGSKTGEFKTAGPKAGSAPPDASVPAIELIGVSRRFQRSRTSPFRPAGGVDALSDVSLTIPQRSRFGVVGESGSGKTTLMRLIAALDHPTSGRILVEGTDIAGRREKDLRFLRRIMQIVFQDPMASLDPRMKVGSIIAEPLRVLGRRDIDATVGKALVDVGLDVSAAARFPHQFSGGQRQRISIARAIAPGPRILIADEATSALDVTIRAQILELIEDLAARQQLTLIFVSHDLSVIRRVCDKVAVLQGGRLVETGTTAQVYSRPSEQYTRDLLAAVPTLERSLAAARRRAGAGGADGADDEVSSEGAWSDQ